MQGILANRLLVILVVTRGMGEMRSMVTSRRLAVHAFQLALGCAMRGQVGGGRGAVHLDGGPRKRCRRPRWVAAIAVDAGSYRLHVRAVEAVETGTGGGNHLRTEGAGLGARQTAISRVLDAVDDGGLAVVTVVGGFRIDDSFDNASEASSRVRCVDARRCQCRGRLGDLVGRRVSRVRRTMGRVKSGTEGSVPTGLVLILFVES